MLRTILQNSTMDFFLSNIKNEIMRDNASTELLGKLISLILAYVHYKDNSFSKLQGLNSEDISYAETSVH
jgi:hypothetical protein